MIETTLIKCQSAFTVHVAVSDRCESPKLSPRAFIRGFRIRNIEETTRHLSHVTYQFSMTPTFVKLGGKLAAAIGGRDRLLEPPSLPSLFGDTDELCEKKTTSRLDDGDFGPGKRKRAKKKGSLL
ncbi:hypothetical protein V1477_002529 [Vespula maculifrons]|uniref:Uncharacterized protein n=1 Tax=Vespula maculifrons TaxID=7453 RepID=A0ABD2CWR1_VESMC